MANRKKAVLAGTRGGVLKAPPILIRPFNQQQRDAFQAAADREGMKLSPFMLHCVKTFIEQRQMKVRRPIIQDQGERGEATSIMVYPFNLEQRESFVAAAEREGMNLSPFVIHCVNTFIEQRRLAQQLKK